MTISNSRLEALLAQSATFQSRVQMTLTNYAASVLSETGIGTTHAARVAFARQILANPNSVIPAASVFLAQSTNVTGTITMEDEGARTSVTDAALASQIATDFNRLAGLDSGN